LDPGELSAIDQKPLQLMLMTAFDYLSDRSSRCMERDFADGPVDGITLGEVKVVGNGHGDVSKEAAAVV
jgi:hypothetical protein